MSAFTVLYDKVAHVIHTQLGISDVATEDNVHHIKTFPTHAIWDTGASGCAITSKVVEELGLKPTSSQKVFTATGADLPFFQDAFTSPD